VGAILGLFGGGEVSPAVGEAALAVEDPALDFLRMVARAPGEPLLMVPSGDLPEVEVE
jgi:hypothetical protein